MWSSDVNLGTQHRDDAVHAKAKELRITPRELFSRAFLEAGQTRADAEKPFAQYSKKKGPQAIPQVVLDFCEKPAPKCSNQKCPDPTKLANVTRLNVSGRPSYFCSIECMDVTPKDTRTETEIAEEHGLEILERVRRAMSAAEYVKVSPDLIRPLEGQPRTHFGTDRQMKLVQSLKTIGQMQPGIIRRVSDDAKHSYELLDGERRLRGVIEAELPEYRAMLVEIDNEAAPFVISVISNFNRAEHTLIEIADAVRKMHEDLKLPMRQIGDMIGIHEVEASQLYGLRRLTPQVRDMLDPHLAKRHTLPKGAAIEISRQPEEKQLDLAERMMRKEFTVAGLKEHIRENSGGSTTRTRRLNPSERRESALARSRGAATTSTALLRLLNEKETAAALQQLTTAERSKLRENIATVEANIAKCAAWVSKNLTD